jgi:hypothetical protein
MTDRGLDHQEKMVSLQADVQAAVGELKSTFPGYLAEQGADTVLMQRLLDMRKKNLGRFQYKTQHVTRNEILGYNGQTFMGIMDRFHLAPSMHPSYEENELYEIFIDGLIQATQFQIDEFEKVIANPPGSDVDTLRDSVRSETRAPSAFPSGTTVIVNGHPITSADQMPAGVTISGVTGTGKSPVGSADKFAKLAQLEALDGRTDEPLGGGEEQIDDMEGMRRMKGVKDRKTAAIAEAERAFADGEIDAVEKKKRIGGAKMAALQEMVEIDRLLKD